MGKANKKEKEGELKDKHIQMGAGCKASAGSAAGKGEGRAVEASSVRVEKKFKNLPRTN